MKNRKIIYMAFSVSIILALLSAGCALIPDQGISYDPAKRYAAFLVLNNDIAKGSLATMQKRSTDEQLEIGPVEYYNAGTKDFETALKKLTASKQVTVVWIITDFLHVNDIKAAMANIEYKGPYRYALVSGQGPVTIQP
jgi:hypothetical protein